MAADESSNKNGVEEPSRVSFRDGRLARRKAEEAAMRRFEAVSWLESMAGPLGLSTQHPTEQEFVSCLRSGLVLCKAMNKVKPGAVPKVVAKHSVSSPWDLQPLPAYQYFENVRNFLAAVRELQLPAFEASDLERDTLEVGSVKVVDCILALKSFHEFRKASGGNYASLSRVKTPLVSKSVNLFWSKDISSSSPANPRRLDMTHAAKKEQSVQNGRQGSQDAMDSLVKVISDLMFDSRENIDRNLLDSWNEGNTDHVSLFSKILSKCQGGEQLEVLINALPFEGNMPIKRGSSQAQKHCKLCIQKGNRYCCCLLEAQEKEVMELRALLSRTRMDFISLRSQLQDDFVELENQVKSMSTSASGYDKAFKENRHLYNVLQELKGHIRVFCRIRPIYLGAKSSIDHIANDGSLMIFDPLNPQTGRKIFQFNKVFGSHATQDEVYRETQGLIRSVMDGYNVCIFAYGQTGSGKTYTMCGPSSELGKEMGLNYMALNDLFRISNIRKNVKYEIRVQMVEIYNEKVHDLLTEDAVNTKYPSCFNNFRFLYFILFRARNLFCLSIDDDITSEIRIYSSSGSSGLPEATMQLVQSTIDVVNLMNLGERNRAFGSKPLDESSHSHRVLTVHVHGDDISGDTINSCLHLVDLAGSERVDKSDAVGGRLNEAQHVNRSLSCLEDVITALAQKNSHIPYQNSKLTQVLQSSLGRNAKMLIFAHVSPEGDFYEETMSTLNFAQRASTVELGTAHVNKENSEIRELKNQIDGLKKALTMKEWEKTTIQHKMQENTPVLEKSKPMERTPPRSRRLSIDNGGVKSVSEKSKPMERTPPRPRRLSIDNGGVKTGTSVNANDRKMLKTPISRSKFVCTPPISNRRLSSGGSKSEINKGALIYSDSKQRSIPTEEPLERNDSCALLDLHGPDVKKNSSNEKFISGVEAFAQSPYTCSTYSKSRLPKLEINSRPHLGEKTPVTRQSLNEITPAKSSSVIKSHPRGPSNNASSKGLQIRKSIQNIGKLINGSSKRNPEIPSETPSKFSKSIIIDSKSPVPANARLRRQSLTGAETIGLNTSRRSSLGGKSVDSYSNSSQTARTPPPVRTTKKWL